MNKIKTWLLRILSILFILLIASIIFLQSSFFLDILRDQIVKQANLLLPEAEIKLAEIEGNIFYSLEFIDFTLKQDSEVILSFQEMKIDYKLWPLLRKKIVLEEISLVSPQINLHQNDQAEWNFLTLLPPEKEATENPTSKQTFDWKIDLQNFELSQAEVSIEAENLPSQIPRQISDLKLDLSAEYSQNRSKLNLQECSFISSDPQLELHNLSLQGKLENDTITLENFLLQTAENKLQLAATYDISQAQPQSFYLETQNFDLNEFAAFLPELPLKKLPIINLQAALDDQAANIALNFTDDQQTLQSSIIVDSLFTTPHYQAKVELNKLNLADWLRYPKLESQINLDVNLSGSKFKPKTANLELVIDLYPGYFNNLRWEPSRIEIEKLQENISINSQLKSNLVDLQFSGSLIELFSTPQYQLAAKINNLDLSQLNQNSALQSELNFQLNLTGKNFELSEIESELTIVAKPSTFDDFPLDSLRVDLAYNKQKYQIRDFLLQTAPADFSLSGFGKLNGNNQLEYNLELKDLAQLQDYLSASQLAASGNISGKITGTLDSWQLRNQLNLRDLQYNDLELAQLRSQAILEKSENLWQGDLGLALASLSYQAYQLDTLQINLHGNQDKIQNQLFAAADTLTFQLDNWLRRDSLITVGIDKFRLSSGQLIWQNQDKQARIFIDQENYLIQDFTLTSAASTLKVSGSFSPSRAENLGLEISQFDLALLNPFSPGLPKLSGKLDFLANLNGDFANPQLKSKLEIQNLSLEQTSFNSLQLEADLSDQLLSSKFQIQKQANENFTGSALLPLQLNNPQQLIDPYKELSVKLALSELDLKFVEGFSDQIDKVGGIIKIDFTLSNTLQNPQLNGNFLLKEGYLNFPDYGLNYPKVNINLSFKQRQMNFEKFIVNSSEGQLQLQGWARLQQDFRQGIEGFELQATAKDFAAANREGLEILTNMQLSLQGDMQNPRYNGNLTLEKARINLDTLPHSQTSQVDINEPLLVQASRSEPKTKSKQSQDSAQQLDILQQLQGSLRLQIPKNTWIRNKDLNVEISGDLQVVKNSANFELFGSVSTLRGSYNLYGRKFDLSDGRVIFNGGKEINPILDLSIRYDFRDQNKQKRELEIALSGNAKSPSIFFYLDGEELNEADAISYLLFGRSSDQITQSQRSEVASQNESSLASILLARQIGGQIASEIGKTLNLDVVEFSGGDNWKEASVLVGKYITNDIFLSYEKEFSVGSTKNYNPDKISLEYGINRYLSLRATSGSEKNTGIDLFWKYQKK